jgi:hypothetical protein
MKRLLAYGILYSVRVGLPVGVFVAIYVISGWWTLGIVSVVMLAIILLAVALAWAKITLGIKP